MRVSIIIPSHDGLSLLRDCLPGVEAQTFQDFELIVVDDGGTDETPTYLHRHHPRARVVRLPRNRGFAAACNAGLDAARGAYVALLGNDNLPEPAWLENLVRVLDAHPEAAIVESRSITPLDPDPGPFRTISLLGYNKVLSAGRPRDARPVPTFYACGNALLFRRGLVDPLFDEDYFMYGEDASLGWRLRLAGHQVLHAPGAVTRHLLSRTSSRNPGRTAFYQTRNRMLNLLTHYEGTTLTRLAPWIVGDIIGTLLFRSCRMARARAFLWLANHLSTVLRKRRDIQRERRRTDRDLIPYLAPATPPFDLYFKAVGMSTLGLAVRPPQDAP